MSAQDGYARILARRYAVYGKNVSFRNPKTGAIDTLRLIDMTQAADIDNSSVMVATVTPYATARKADLTALGYSPSDMIGGDVTLNGVVWTVQSHKPKPSVHGPEGGEVLLMLETPCV